MSSFKMSIADWGENTLVQGLNYDQNNNIYIGHRADNVSGQTEQDVQFIVTDAKGNKLNKVIVKKGGHGSSTGLFIDADDVYELWFGHDGLRTSGYVRFKRGESGVKQFVKMALPEGDIEIDQANNILVLRNGNRYRVYYLDSVRANKRIKIADFTIPSWGARWQGMYVSEGRLFIHRDVRTKGASRAHMYDLTGKPINFPASSLTGNKVQNWIDTSEMGDEAEGFLVKSRGDSIDVYAVKRTGPSGTRRVIELTLIATFPKLKSPWDGKSFPGADAFDIGSRHPAVKLLGERLVAHGWTGYKSGPGVPMSETDKAGIKWWQEKQGWTGTGADGIPGPLTWSTLMEDPDPVVIPPENDVSKLPAYYPPANRTAQWYPSIAGGASFTKVDKLILHTTEGGNWFDYSGVGYGPHLTYKPETREWRQHIPLTKSATALRNDGSYKTNQENCIQIEIIGYAKNARLWSSSTIEDVGALIKWLSKYGLLIQAPKAFTPYPPGINVKMSRETYRSARGIIGHEHVPGNSHGDPGDPPIDLVLKAARGESIAPPVLPEKPETPSEPIEPDSPIAFPGPDAFKIGSQHPAVVTLGERLVAHGWKGYSVGPGIPMGLADKYGVQWFQGLQGWDGEDADGIPGKVTWERLLAAPVHRRTPPPNGAPIFGSVTTGFKVKGSWAWSQGHPGEDWNGPDPDFGNPVFAVRSGIVKYIGRLPWDQKTGNAYGDRALVIQDAKSGLQTLYAHMNSCTVRLGQRVQVGDQVGTIGFSGYVIPANKQGSHVHIERRKSPYRYGTDVVKPLYND